MARPLPNSITCYYSDRIAGTLVFDPAEASPSGAPAGPYVRFYDTGSLPLSPWVELAWNSLDPVTSEPVIATALELYARREEREEEARRRQAHRQRRRLREYRNAQAVEKEEARYAARSAEASRRAAVRAQEAERARVADADLRARRDLAVARHRESASDDAVLQVFKVDGAATANGRSVILYDPHAQPGGDDLFVFVPFGDTPLTVLERAGHPSEHPGAHPIYSKSRRRKIISRYRAWQAKEAEEKRRDAFRAALSNSRRALQAPVVDSLPLDRVPLMRSDVSLALNWCRGENGDLHDLLRERLGRCGWQRAELRSEVRRSYRKDGEWPRDLTLFKRMLSARLAEKAVKQFYEKHDPALAAPGRELVDMSIRQVKTEQPFDPTYDLGYPEDASPDVIAGTSAVPKRLDVKNTQLDPSDPNGYSRHYVKKLRVLDDGSTVRVVGAVSEITSLGELLAGHGRVRILGEVDRTQIDRLQREYGLSYLKLKLTADEKPGQFYPPWIFEALPFVVSSRVQALNALRTAYDAHPEPETEEVVPVPIALAAGIPLHPAQRTALSAGQLALTDMLLQHDFVLRRSLPDLYLILLRQFFTLLEGSTEERVGYDPAESRVVVPRCREAGTIGDSRPATECRGLAGFIVSVTGAWLEEAFGIRMVRVSGGGYSLWIQGEQSW